MSLADLTVEAVNSAIAEWNSIGGDAFLKKYGFNEAREYFLIQDGQRYSSKAIAGAAHGYLEGREPLKSEQFSGGLMSVAARLQKLGFEVTEPADVGIGATPGEILTNDEIARRFLVGNMGGMRRSRAKNHLVLISDPFKGLYQDRWEGNVLHYTGMGKLGAQSLDHSQNRTLAESVQTGIPVHLFEALDPKRYTYAGKVRLSGEPYREVQPDDEGKERNVWMFPLQLAEGAIRPLPTAEQARVVEQEQGKRARKLSDEELERRARAAHAAAARRQAKTTTYVRDPAVAEYAKRRASGVCDLCRNPAPFSNGHGEPYLECHHITWLSEGGEDTIENTVALCPNCHRKMHVLNREQDQRALRGRATEKATRA